jgi:hypothetical protein
MHHMDYLDLMGNLAVEQTALDRQELSDTQFYPTLMIGLGGTGAQVLLRVKKMLRERLRGVKTLHRFLFLDSDLKTFSGIPGLPPIDGSEKCLIGVENALRPIDYPSTYEWLWERIPRDRLNEESLRMLAGGTGCGQIRSLGATALLLDHANVYDRMNAAYSNLIDMADTVDATVQGGLRAVGNRVLVYIVGSLAGGTGSGCFLDVAVMAKEICSRSNPGLIGYFALANECYFRKVGPVQINNMKSNTFAALKELQYILDASDARGGEVIPYRFGPDRRVLLTSGEKLFDSVSLVDDRNKLGRVTEDADLYDLIALTLFQEVGAQLGSSVRSHDTNEMMTNTIAPCPITNRPRRFSTFATSSLLYPAERVAEYCTFKAVDELVHDQLRGSRMGKQALQAKVGGFLAGHNLEERGANNQVLESLLHDEARQLTLSVGTEGLPHGWGQDKSAREFGADLRMMLDQFTAVQLTAIKRLVKDNFEEMLRPTEATGCDKFYDLVCAFALQVAGDEGIDSVEAALVELDQTVAQMRRELETEQGNWTSRDRDACEQGLNETCLDLQKLGLFGRMLGHREEELKSNLVQQYNTLVENHLWDAAKPQAILMMNVLGNHVKEQLAAWQSLSVELAELEKKAENRWRDLETHSGTAARTYVVTQEITNPGYEQQYYQELGLSSADHLATLIREFGARAGQADTGASKQGLFKWMLKVKAKDRINAILEMFLRCLYGPLAEPLLKTDLVQFITQHPQEVAVTIKSKLDMMYGMCQPFWPADGPPAPYTEFMALTVRKQRGQGGQLVTPSIVEEWVKQQAGDKALKQEILHGAVPYEIVLSRRTSGARAFYLKPLMGWKTIYKDMLKRVGKKFMAETHIAFTGIPDIAEQDGGAGELFALGLAFGFVASRGSWYYFVLDKGLAASGAECIQVLYQSQAPTVFSVAGEVPPAAIAKVQWAMRKGNPSDELLLAQGRDKATEALGMHLEWADLIKQAIDEVHKERGNGPFIALLDRYIKEALEPNCTRESDDSYTSEASLIEATIRRIRGLR